MKGFSYPYDPEIHAAARGAGLNVSPKAAREVCHALKGMELEKAKTYLERVIVLNKLCLSNAMMVRLVTEKVRECQVEDIL